MSKRKQRTKSLVVDKSDMQFEDDSSSNLDLDELNLLRATKSQTQVSKINTKASGSRVSARGKREKKIYDPSDHNVPVHKKKKEAIEAQMAAAKKMTPQKLTKTPVKTPVKNVQITDASQLTKAHPTPQSAKRKLDMGTERLRESPLEKVQKTATAISVAKDTSKRIQLRKENSVDKTQTEVPEIISKSSLVPVKSILRVSESSERSVQTASTVPVQDNHNKMDVSKWTPNDVAAYFVRQGFDKKDADKFKEQEIDGETLLILQRDDLKNLHLKVGVFVKMWKRILRFQSGKHKFVCSKSSLIK